MSFTEKLAQSGATPIHYIRTYDGNGQPCYFFLMCPLSRLRELEEDRKNGRPYIDLTEYGKIVASGFGHEPDEYTLYWLKEIYQYELPQTA
jgi:hypothetical protein